MQSDRRFLVAAIIIVGVLEDDCRTAAKALAHVEQPWRGIRTAGRLHTSGCHQEIQASVAQTAPDAIVRGLGPASAVHFLRGMAQIRGHSADIELNRYVSGFVAGFHFRDRSKMGKCAGIQCRQLSVVIQ